MSRQFDRRAFLETSTAATLAAGYFVSESAAQQTQAAGDKLVVAIMGVNGRGGALAPAQEGGSRNRSGSNAGREGRDGGDRNVQCQGSRGTSSTKPNRPALARNQASAPEFVSRSTLRPRPWLLVPGLAARPPSEYSPLWAATWTCSS